jgi:SAM-dependent methyltransferase
MEDRFGKFLLKLRIDVVLPQISGKLLDIGCGTNKLVAAYKGNGTGVDVYPWDGVDLVVEDTAKLPFEKDSFDTVAIVAALNHIPNREEVLEETSRVLRSGGKLVITMIPPGISRIWHFLRSPWDVDQKNRGMIEGEVYGLTKQKVITLLNNAGFRIVHEAGFMLCINRLTVAVKE